MIQVDEKQKEMFCNMLSQKWRGCKEVSLVIDSGEGTFAVNRAVDGLEIKPIIKIIDLNFSLTTDVNVVDHKEFLINVGRLQQSQPGRGPQS
jgi:hypothetical protein